MDMNITCKDCGKKFTMTEKEIQWYTDKGLQLPKRCSSCRKKRKAGRDK